MTPRPTFGVAIALLLAVSAGAAEAQMVLPGANNGNAAGTPPKASGGGGGGNSNAPSTYVPPKPIYIKPPSQDTIVGQTLSRDGKSGAMSFDKAGDGVALTRLKLDGDKISRPQDGCKVDVSIATPIAATPTGRPAGALRFDIPLEACPFTIDVLDGAVLVSRADPSCDFKAADCRVTPGGLWGPAAVDISASRVKDLEHQRLRIETTMRTNFRALLKKAGKNRVAVKEIARDQAAFSSQREMTCRDYDQESVHGFCSTQITEARALELLAKFGPVEDIDKDHKRTARQKNKAKPVAASPPPDGPVPEPPVQDPGSAPVDGPPQ